MKLQIAFDMTDLGKAMAIADEIHDFADIIEVGSLLIYKNGDQAVRTFKEKFPEKTILADTKVVDRGKEAAQLFAQAGADWITVMAGTSKYIIHSVTQRAHELGKLVMLDLLDSSSMGQSALEAKGLGADALLFHRNPTEEERTSFLEQWDMVRGNTPLPIFIAGSFTTDTIGEIASIKPAGVVLSTVITQADNPKQVAAQFRSLIGADEAE